MFVSGGKFEAVGGALGLPPELNLPDGQSFDDWVAVGRHLVEGGKALNWWIGDWWIAGSRRYGERAKVAAEGVFGKEFQTLIDLATVARRFETTRRRVALSFTHHREVASLPLEQADELLDKAEREKLSTRALRQEVKAVSEPRERDIIDVRSEPDGADGLSAFEIAFELAQSLKQMRPLNEREQGFFEYLLRRVLGYREWQVYRLIISAAESGGPAPCFSQIRDELGFLDKRDARNVVRRLEERSLVFRCGYTDPEQGQPVIRLSLSPPLESQ